MILPTIIATDFDGTLCENEWPRIGAPNLELINYLKCKKERGARIILWTCRYGKELKDAVEWCKNYGLYFDAVNDNVKEAIEMFGGNNTRKVFAHEYIDDKFSNKFELPFTNDDDWDNW